MNAQIEGQDELPGKSNYFQGHVSSAWHTNVSNYRKVRYTNIYPGIDLVYYGNQRQLEHDFIVAPGADPKVIRLSFTGANSPSIERNGDLRIQTPNGLAKLKKPVLYQQIDGVRRPVTGRYVRSGRNELLFRWQLIARKS